MNQQKENDIQQIKYETYVDIITHADDFCEAYKRCTKGGNPTTSVGSTTGFHCVNVPAIVNGAFACELYLKSLSRNKIKQHELVFWFDNLRKTKRKEITEKWSASSFANETIEEALGIINKAFENWRYLYEAENIHLVHPKYVNEYLRILTTLLPILKEVAYKYYKKDN